MKFGTRIAKPVALALTLACALSPLAFARTVKQKKQAASVMLENANRLRDDLLGTPEADRERRDYNKVIDLYRKVYYTAPSLAKADVAVLAVAELLDDQGRVFNDPKSYKDAIGQLAFLRREYPGSKHRVEALFTIGEIYRDDLKDAEQAKATFQDYLKHYPHSQLAPKAMQAISEIDNAENGPSPFKKKGSKAHRTQHGSEPKAAWADVESSPRPANNSAAGNTKKNSSKTVAKAGKPKADDQSDDSANDDAPSANANTRQNEDEITAPSPQTQPQTTQDVSIARPGLPPVNRMPRLTSIRSWSTPDYVRVAIDLEQEVQYQSGRVPRPDRIFFDLYGVKLASDLVGKTFDVEAGFLHKIRVAQFKSNMARVVLDVDDVAEYSAFLLPNPYRLIIDIHGKMPPHQVASAKPDNSQPMAEVPGASSTKSQQDSRTVVQDAMQTPANGKNSSRTPANSTANNSSPSQSDVTVTNIRPNGTKSSDNAASALQRAEDAKGGPLKNGSAAIGSAGSRQPATTTKIAKLDPPRVVVDDTLDQPDQPDQPVDRDTAKDTAKPTSGPTYQAVAPQQSSRNKKNRVVTETATGKAPASATTTHTAAPTANGERSLIRALGLKIGKIVVDAGHGGHDTGTIGPNGLAEKDLVLDVALKLGKELENRLGAEVVYTRDDDTFIPLETRTAVANKEQADLFISIHANSSSDQTARGVETYYLNFTSSRDALETAARENAVSEKSIHELQDLVKKIALKEKIEESREFAADVQKSLYVGLNSRNPGIRNRGVKKAPFIVLIGANMPSILAEISFVSNPNDEKKLRTSEYRQRIADSLYKGVSSYINGLSGIKVAASKVDPSEVSTSSVAAK
jgi:N-acetylmuramoyl-L-alanine amidase